jgi:hypothetical protein
MEKKMKTLNRTLLAVALSVAFTGAQAATIDPDGAGAGGALSNIGILDWTVGNAIVTPTGNANVTNPQVGDVFQTYAHARLASFNDAGGTPQGSLFGNNEWTYVAGFKEQVYAVSGTPGTGSATFNTIAGSNNFFQIWYSNTAGNVSDNLTGKGFQNGTLILSGTILPFDFNDPNKNGQTSFTANTPVDAQGNLLTPALDQNAPTNNYPNTQTITGQGGGRIEVQVNSWDSAFFPDFTAGILLVDFNTQMNLPYNTTDPSSCFWNGTQYINGVGPITGGTAAQRAAGCSVNSVGAINGLSGPNEVLMTDSSTTLPVPEPITLALFGAGALAMGAAGRRKA